MLMCGCVSEYTETSQDEQSIKYAQINKQPFRIIKNALEIHKAQMYSESWKYKTYGEKRKP